MPCKQRGRVCALPKKRSTLVILLDGPLDWHGSDSKTKERLGLSGRFGDSETRSQVSDRDMVRVGEGV